MTQAFVISNILPYFTSRSFGGPMEWAKIGPPTYNLCIIIILRRVEGTRKNTRLWALSASPWLLAGALLLLMKPKEKIPSVR